MKAVFIEQHGGPEVLRYGDLPDPMPKPGEVVVDVLAASVNGADWKVRAGESHRQSQFPYILGRDFSGMVGALGDGVRDLRVGDPVFGVLRRSAGGRLRREDRHQGRASSRRSPSACRMPQAAALALTGLTALSRHRGDARAAVGRDHPDPGRRRRRRELRHPARQAYRRPRDHHRERRQPRLSARPRRR